MDDVGIQRVRRATSWLAIALALCLFATVVILATQSNGRASTRATFNDGGAWIANNDRGVVAHLNRPVRQISGEVSLSSTLSGFEIMQAPGIVVAFDESKNQVVLVDEDQFVHQPPLDLPRSSNALIAPNALVVVDTNSNAVFRLNRQQLSALRSFDELVATYQGVGTVQLAVGRHGLIGAYDAGADALVRIDNDGVVAVAPLGLQDGGADPARAEVTVVGDTVVAHFPTAGALSTWSGDDDAAVVRSRDLGERILLQQPGSEASDVAGVSPSGALTLINLQSGATGELAQGIAQRRVIAYQDCVFSLTTAVELRRDCPSQDPSLTALDADNSSNLKLALVNGWIWVHDATNGAVWVGSVNTEVTRIDDWGILQRQDEEEEASGDSDADDAEQVEDNDDPNAILGDADREVDEDDENDVPIARRDETATRAGRPIVVPVLENDEDPDGDVLVIDSVEPVAVTEGVVQRTDDGLQVQFTPQPGFEGVVGFRYTISDGRGGTATTTVSITVLADDEVNDPPRTATDIASTSTTSPVSINVIENDSDPNGDSLVLVSTSVDEGRVDFSADGRVTYFPDAANRGGEVPVSYTVRDDRGLTAEGTLRVLIREESNQKPDARNDVATIRVGQIARLNVLHNDSDPDGDPLRITTVPARQDISITASGELLFEATEPGTIVDSYGITDGELIDEAQIRIEVLEAVENQPPIPTRDDVILSRGESKLVPVMVNDGDPDGDIIALTEHTEAAGFKVQLFAEEFLVIEALPTAPDFAEILYFVSDGINAPVAGTVVVSVTSATPANQSPVARADSLEIRPSQPAVVPVLVNDFDPDGDSLQIVDVGQVEGVDLEVSDDGLGVRVLVPEERRAGFTFTYEISDGLNRTGTTVKVRIIPPEEPNRAPIAQPDKARTEPGQTIEMEVTRNDSDPDGDIVRLESISQQGSGGVAEVVDGQTLRYTPRRDFAGTDIVKYTLTDGQDRAVGIFQVGVIPEPLENRPPVAVDDPGAGLGVADGGQLEIDSGSEANALRVLANDSDPDGDPFAVIEIIAPDEIAGELALVRNGFDIAYTPPTLLDDVPVPVVFAYTIADRRGGTAQATVRLLVVPAENVLPQPPVALDATTPPSKEGTSIQFSLLDSVTDADGDVAQGSFAFDTPGLSLGGGLVEIPIERSESFTFGYTFTDEQGLADDGLISVIVDPDLPPVVEPITETTEFETPITIDVMALASDPEGLPLTGTCCDTSFGGSATAEQGTLDLLTITFTPDPGFSGPASYTFSINDDFGNTVSSTALIEVLPRENTPPTADTAIIDVEAGTSLPIDLEQFVDDIDLPEDELRLTSVELQVGGGVTLQQTNWLLEIAAPDDAQGVGGTIAYTVVDQRDASVDGTLQIQVGPTRTQPPQATDNVATTNQGQAVTVAVTPDDAFFIGDSLVLESVQQSAAGVTEIQGSDSVTFTPQPDFFGSTQFTYTVADSTGRQASATVRVEVIGRPSQPPAPVATATTREAQLTWGSPDANGAPIEEYEVEFEGGDSVSVGVSASHTWQGLDNGTAYRFRVRANNVAGWSEWSSYSNSVTPDQLPEAPGSPSVVFGDQQIDISWAEPVNAGSAITEYNVSISGAGDEVRETGTTSMVWRDLDNGTAYCFKIRARNGKGWSEWGRESCETPAGVPATPDAPVAVRGDKLVDLSWTAPDNNGDALAAYEIETSTDSSITITPAQAYRWGDLTNGAEISFRIRAENKAGFSEWSPMSEVVIPAGEPFEPSTPVAADDQDKQSALTISAPNNNGAAISTIEVRNETTAAVTTVNVSNPAEGSNIPYVAENLTNGTSYQFSVRACNEVGCGNWSAASSSVIPKGPPCRVALQQAQPSYRLVTLTISTNPASEGMSSCDNGAGAFDYLLEVDGSAAQVVSVSGGTTIAFTGVDARCYVFRVWTGNSVGESTPSSVAEACTPGRPCAPALSVSGQNLQAVTSWVLADGCENGAAIDNFEVETSPGSSVETTQTSLTQSLAIGTYQFRVRAHNIVGWGDFSAWQSATVYTYPCTPSLNAQGGTREITGSFSHNAECGNESQIVEYEIDIESATQNPSTPGNFTFADLDDGTYQVRVRARNEAGWGDYGAQQSVAVIDRPDPPSLTVSGGINQASAQWSTNANGSPISQWDVDDGGMPGAASSTATNHEWTGVPAASYTVRVRAFNEAGWSDWTSKTVAVSAPAPRVVLSQGAVTGVGGGCDSGNCWYHVLQMTNMPAGTRTVRCYGVDPNGPDHYFTYTTTSDFINNRCFWGYPTRDTWVTVSIGSITVTSNRARFS